MVVLSYFNFSPQQQTQALSTVSLLVLFEQAKTLLENRNNNLLVCAAVDTMRLDHGECGQLSAA